MNRFRYVALIMCLCTFAPHSTAQETNSKQSVDWWSHLAGSELESTRALLYLLNEPQKALDRCKQELRPLILDEARLRELVDQLGSKDQESWTGAYDRLSYLDPRLFGNVEEIMGRVTDEPARARMIGILSYTSLNRILENGGNLGSRVSFEPLGGSFDKVKFSRPGLGWHVDCRVEHMTNNHQKPSWDRAMRALLLLETIGSVEAEEFIQVVATGHPKAAPTRLAFEISERFVEADATTSATQQELDQWWASLKVPGLESTHATLNLARYPKQSTELFQQHLQPLKLSDEQLQELVNDLGSSNDEKWHSVYRQMEYLDPRLAKTIPEIFDSREDSVLTRRLIAVLSGWSLNEILDEDTYHGKLIRSDGMFYHYEVGGIWCFNGGNSSWEATELSLICDPLRKVRPEWDRANRALAILNHFATPDAIDVIQSMSTGNPKAAPTRTASALLN